MTQRIEPGLLVQQRYPTTGWRVARRSIASRPCRIQLWWWVSTTGNAGSSTSSGKDAPCQASNSAVVLGLLPWKVRVIAAFNGDGQGAGRYECGAILEALEWLRFDKSDGVGV